MFGRALLTAILMLLPSSMTLPSVSKLSEIPNPNLSKRLIPVSLPPVHSSSSLIS